MFKKHPISFASTLIAILMLCAIVMAMLFLALQVRETRSWFTEITEKTLTEKSQYVGHQIEIYLNKPRQAGILMSELVKASTDVDAPVIETELAQVFERYFSQKDSISRLGLATATGKYVAYERDIQTGQIFLVKTSTTEKDRLNIYHLNSENSHAICHVDNYNLFSRPWFIKAMTQDKPFWASNYYPMTTSNGATMSWRLPLYNDRDEFQGVLFSDINLATISHYLATSLPTAGSTVLLMDNQQQIVSASRPEYLSAHSVAVPGQEEQVQTLYSFPALTALLKKVNWQFQATQRISLEGSTHIVITRPVYDASGMLKWTLVMIAPDAHPLALFKTTHVLTLIILSTLALTFMLLLIMLVKYFFTPLHQLVQKTHLLGQRSWEPIARKTLFSEIVVLEQELSNASGLIGTMLNEQRQRLEKDSDTGMLTREGFINEPALFEQRNLMLMIRVTNFRDMRTTLGHQYARHFIRFFADNLRQIAPAESVFCRYAEDLFIVAFPGLNERKDLDTYWGLISSLFQDTPGRQAQHSEDSATHVFTGHAGAVLETITRQNVPDCMMNAGLALQQIRQDSNREFVLFEPEMRENELNNIRMFQALREDLLNDGFHLVLQPIVDLDDPQTFKEGECLVRWLSSELGFVPPDVFIGLAERTGTIIKLGRWIIEEACRELAAFIARGAPEDFKLHINISAVQLQQPDFSSHLLQCIQSNGLINGNICLEITESVLLQNSKRVIETLNYLRRLGLSVAIDDFGSGYSSLSYLHLLPFDCLKIDRDFVKGVLDDRKSEAIISSVIMLSRAFDVPLVAEGIETAEVGEKLQALGCVKAQGYYYSRPERFSAWSPQNGVITVESDEQKS